MTMKTNETAKGVGPRNRTSVVSKPAPVLAVSKQVVFRRGRAQNRLEFDNMRLRLTIELGD